MSILKNIFFSFFILFSTSCQNNSKTTSKPKILVSISPYQVFIETIVDGFADVVTIVPKNQNPHFFSPSIKQISNLNNAELYFRIGEFFEEKIIPSLLDKNPSIAIVDLRNTISLIPIEKQKHGDHYHGSMDIHLWLSPKTIEKQLTSIEKALLIKFPDKRPIIVSRVKDLQSKLIKLNNEIADLSLKNVSFLSSHAAFAYFCRDFGCVEIPLEIGQKEPTAKYLELLMNLSKTNRVKTMVIIPHMNDLGARSLADKLHINKVIFDPYSENYFENLHSLAKKISEHAHE